MGSNEENIIKLRKNGLSINNIAKELNLSKGTVSRWCKLNGINDIGLDVSKKLTYIEIEQLKEFYLNNTQKETAIKFGVSTSTVKKYSNLKRIKDVNKIKKNREENKLNRRIKIKIKAIEYKGGECQICGYNKCRWALDFHHTSSDKEFNISSFYNRSWEKIVIELDKCMLVCSNCHREIHYNEINGV